MLQKMSPQSMSLLYLPTEILLMILDIVPKRDLLSISQVSRRLNCLALERYFSRCSIPYDPQIQSLGNIVLKSYPTWNVLLHVLHRAIFVSAIKRLELVLEGVVWYSHRNVYKLELLVSNVSLSHIKEVVLNLTILNFSMQPPNWTKVFRGMTKAISQRSCEKLTIVGGLFPSAGRRPYDNDGDIKRSCPRWFRSDPAVIPISAVARQQRLLKLTRTHQQTEVGLRDAPFELWPLCTLKTLHIRSPIITRHPFLCWTISSINSSPITVISFSRLGMISSLAWGMLLHCLTIPTLTSLCIATSSLIITDLISFLSRHPQMETLNLSQGRLCIKDSTHQAIQKVSKGSLAYSAFLPRDADKKDQSSITLLYPLSPPPRSVDVTYHHLVTLSATPQHLAYILAIRLRNGQDLLPNLASISINVIRRCDSVNWIVH